MDTRPKMVIVVRKDLKMRRGKECAQSGHAASAWMLRAFVPSDTELKIALTPLQQAWLDPNNGNFAKIVVSCDSEAELNCLIQTAEAMSIDVHKITDAGRTEFHGVPTVTCAAFGPDLSEKLDPVTGHLKLM